MIDMVKKEFVNGLYPEKDMRVERVREIEQMLNVLVSNREELNKQINQLLFELKILNEMNQLERFIDGEINLEVRDDSTDKS
jgi:hypothetical protein